LKKIEKGELNVRPVNELIDELWNLYYSYFW
jgi:hypothetical protein